MTAIDEALDETGFEACQFGPDESSCDQCGKRHCQLHFGNRDYWDAREGDYCCDSCVIELHRDNQAVMEDLR
ncbi:MAG: hypothetical protein AAGJ40_09220 [Planctomycetota bacterium]